MKSNVTRNPVLTVTAVKFMQDAANFIGRRLAPVFYTGEQSAAYYVFDRENMLNIPRNIQRAPSANYSRSTMVISDDSFNCRQYGHEEPVDDTERTKYASALDADKAATRRAANVVLVNHELRVHAKATGGGVSSSSPSTKWDANGGDPVGDVDAVKELIRTQCGLIPNFMSVSHAVFNVLKELDVILEKIKYVQKGIITPDLLAPIFGVKEFVVAGAVINSAAEGQAITPADIWGESVMLAHVDNSQDLSAPNFMRTFAWTQFTGKDGILVESYREDPIDSDVHRAKQHVDEKLVGAECGYHLSNVLAA